MKRYLIFIFSIVFVILMLSSCFLIQKPALEAPILLMPANGTITSTNVTLSWKTPNYSQSLKYKVFFGTNSTLQYVTTVQSTSFAENDLAYSTKYYWQIVAFDQNGQSATSSVWSFTTEGIPRPSTPVLRVTNVSTNSVILGWTQSKLASMVTIYGSTSTIFTQYAILSGLSTSYTVNDLVPSTVYKFFLVATNASGRATSNTVNATTLSYIPPVKPSIKSFTVTSVSTNTITLGFQTENASVIYIYRLPSKLLLATASGSSTSYTSIGLKPSTYYTYFIVAVNPSGRATSTTLSATTQSYTQMTSFPIYIGDKPVSPSLIQHLYVTLDGFSVHATFGGTSTWYTSPASGTYDLTTLVGTSIKFTGITLPASAMITQMRFEISSATIVVNGKSYPLNIPSSTIYIVINEIGAMESNGVYLDFDISQSVEQTGQGYTFIPVIHTVNGNVRASVAGSVMYNSAPVPMAVVFLSNSSTEVAETYTRPNGKFTISAVQTGIYTLTVNASGLTSYSTSVSLSKGMNNIGIINLSILPPATPVLNVSTSNPYLAVLTWTQSIQNASGFHVWESTSPMQAYTEIATVPGTSYSYDVNIKPDKNYYFMVSAYNQTGEVFSGSVMVSPVTYSVSGYVTYNGNGLAGVTISFSDGLPSVTTNSQGYWSQSGLTGSVTITPSMAGYKFNPPSITVTGANSNVNFTVAAPNTIYVANAGINNVSVINGQTNTVVQTISVGKSGEEGIGVNPTTNMIYVANYSNTVSVINGQTNTVEATISVGKWPVGIGVNPTTNMIYVPNYGSTNVSVINGQTNTVVQTISVENGPWSIGVNPITDMIYVTNGDDVSVINGQTNTVATTISVGKWSVWVGVNPTTDMIYVTNIANNTVSVINGQTNTVATTISVGEGPQGIVVDPTTDMIYVTNTGGNNVSVINGQTNTVEATISVGNYPDGIGVNPITDMIYVANLKDKTISVINGQTNTVVQTISLENPPLRIGVLY